MNDELTCVTGYWAVKNKHGDGFKSWCARTLNVDHPYVVFCEQELAMLERARQNFVTAFAYLPLSEFCGYPQRDKMWTHSTHCPSADLNLIWNEKPFLLQRAVDANCFQSKWFLWVDAGLSAWRQRENPAPLQINRGVLRAMPEDKIIFSSSMAPVFDPEALVSEKYYHHVSGGAFLLHHDCVDSFCELFEEQRDELLAKKTPITDQIVLTHMYARYPELFYKLAHGYGAVATQLFA